MFTATLVTLAALVSTASAAERPRVGLSYSAGASGVTGDLGPQFGALVQDFALETLFLQTRSERLQANLSINTLVTSATHDGDRFPFPADADLRVLSFLFVANLCYRPGESHGLGLCLGLGEGTVNINAPEDRRDYGTWNYRAGVDLALTDHLLLTANARFIGSVEQQVGGVDGAFSVYTAEGGVGWRY